MEGAGAGAASPGEKRLATIARVKELWRQKKSGMGVLSDRKAWTIFISSGRSFEELFLEEPSSPSSSDGEETWYWDPTWMRDEHEEQNRIQWEREEQGRELEWRRKQHARKQADKQAFLLWSSRWDERNLALQSKRRCRSRRGRPQPKPKPKPIERPSRPPVSEKTDSPPIHSKNSSLYFMSDVYDPVLENEEEAAIDDLLSDDEEARGTSGEEERKEREWAKEVSAAEERMERGQDAASRQYKCRREAFYEKRRSTSDLSSSEHDSIDSIFSSNESSSSPHQSTSIEVNCVKESSSSLDTRPVTIVPRTDESHTDSSEHHQHLQGYAVEHNRPQERRTMLDSLRHFTSRKPRGSATDTPGSVVLSPNPGSKHTLRRVLSNEDLLRRVC